MGMNWRILMKSFQKVRRTVQYFSFLAIAAAMSVSAGAANIIVAPVPWAPDSTKAAMGNITDGITFSNLPLEGEIFIYTLSGTLVNHFEFNDGTRKAKWFGRNDAGQAVASGVYFWVVKSGGGNKTGKLIVLR
jgi:hypothetical protein